MSSEDDKLDRFLREIMQEVGLESTPSRQYTTQVMLSVAKFDKSVVKKKTSVIVISILVYLALSMVIYLLWQNGFLDVIIGYINNFKSYLPDFISLKNLGFIIGGFLFYLIVVRVVLTVLLMKNKSGGMQYH